MRLQAGHSEKPSILGLVTSLVSAIIHQSISYQLEYRVSGQVVMVQWEGGVESRRMGWQVNVYPSTVSFHT